MAEASEVSQFSTLGGRMDLFGVGPVEVLVVLVIAVIIFGPEELPGIAVKVARFIRQIRELTDDVTGEFTKEIGSVIQLDEPKGPSDREASRSSVASPTNPRSSPEIVGNGEQPTAHNEAAVSFPQEPVSLSETERPETVDQPGQETPVGEP